MLNFAADTSSIAAFMFMNNRSYITEGIKACMYCKVPCISPGLTGILMTDSLGGLIFEGDYSRGHFDVSWI